MKALYWKIRGIANSPSKLALKRLILLHKPDFLFIAEPWMNFDNFPAIWLNRLGLKLFSCNVKENLLPNLWCFCSATLNHVVINKDDQQISFSFDLDNHTFFMPVVYASANNNKRKELWQNLTLLKKLI